MVIKNTIQLVNSDFFGAFVEKENILRGDIFISSATCPLSALARGGLYVFMLKKVNSKKTKPNKQKQSKNNKQNEKKKPTFWNRIENEIHSRYVRLEFGLSLSLSFFPWYFSGIPRFYFPHR